MMNGGENISIRPMAGTDWPEVKEIYTEGILTGEATFETSCPDRDTWNDGHLDRCRLVAVSDRRLAGWAALAPISERCVYGGVAEVSIYIRQEFRGLGIGSRLLEQLIACSEAAGIWTLQAGIFPENPDSIKLHNKYNFREVGVREKIGKLNGIWRDVLLLERRSSTVGID